MLGRRSLTRFVVLGRAVAINPRSPNINAAVTAADLRKGSIAVPTIANVPHLRHVATRPVTPSPHGTDPSVSTPDSEHLFGGRVCFLPVRTVLNAGSVWSCAAHDVAMTPVTDRDRVMVVDSETRLRVWRRDTVCGRCAVEFLTQRVRDSDVVLCWYADDCDDRLDRPRPLGAILECPEGLHSFPAA